EGFQLLGAAAQIYEAQKVPAIFQPLAELTLAEVGLGAGERVLDVACGTGIVARLAAAKVGKCREVVGIDLNASMIEVARDIAATTPGNFGWHTGDAGALPFDDSRFDTVFCQQGLQFFPDKPAALGEMKRVLRNSGRAVLTIWSEVSPLFAAVGEALAKHFDAELARRAVAPFAFRDGKIIEELLSDAGFQHIDMQTLTVMRRIGPIAESLPKELAGSPIGDDIANANVATRAALTVDVDLALKPFRVDGGVAIPQHTHLIIAR
ncbi:MAG: class I SAM-dependent methyltransferase, partial [Alphaproteobacteria bacterium]